MRVLKYLEEEHIIIFVFKLTYKIISNLKFVSLSNWPHKIHNSLQNSVHLHKLTDVLHTSYEMPAIPLKAKRWQRKWNINWAFFWCERKFVLSWSVDCGLTKHKNLAMDNKCRPSPNPNQMLFKIQEIEQMTGHGSFDTVECWGFIKDLWGTKYIPQRGNCIYFKEYWYTA